MKRILISQYRAALAMLLNSIDKCPDELWENTHHQNSFCRIAYHALFYTALYLSESENHFVPWSKHIMHYNNLGTDTYQKPEGSEIVYSKEAIKSYANDISASLEQQVGEEDTSSSGFSWVPMSRIELHLYNIRHIQHHVGQLTERLHEAGITGIRWEHKG